MKAASAASAPGKVVLSAEYAVLDGAPAICMAVNRRAVVSITPCRGRISTVEAPGYCDGTGEFEITPDGLEWRDGQSSFELVDIAFAAGAVRAESAIAIRLDSSAFADPVSGDKIGIGSSAAVTVALCAAGRRSLDSSALARRVHTELQGGAGSGVDVACSIAGGLIEYRMAGANTTPLRWPAGLHWRLVWTGVSADTRSRLARLDAGVSKPSRVRLFASAERMADAWHSAEAGKIMSEYPAYIETLREFSVDHELGIFDAGHDALARRASAAQLVYKPCGAGGGDVGIVFGQDRASVQRFVNDLPAGATSVDCELGEEGVTFAKTAK